MCLKFDKDTSARLAEILSVNNNILNMESVAEVKLFTPEQLHDFLLAHDIDEESATVLQNEKVNGKMFLEFDTFEDYTSIGLVAKGPIRMILKLREKILESAENGREAIDSNVRNFLDNVMKHHNAQEKELPSLPISKQDCAVFVENKVQMVKDLLKKETEEDKHNPKRRKIKENIESEEQIAKDVEKKESHDKVSEEKKFIPCHEQQVVRKFNQEVSDTLIYTKDNYIKNENSVSYLEPCREFKEFNLSLCPDRETMFVKKVGPFIISCLNARCNGTIYLGVSDNRTGRHIHGQILGVNINPDEKSQLEDFLVNNFTGSNPKMLRGAKDKEKDAIRKCLSSLRFIPIQLGGPIKESRINDLSLFVIELDVEPMSVACEAMIFYLAEKKEKNQNKQREKRQQRYSGSKKSYYFREGTSSNQVLEEDFKSLSDKVMLAAKTREYHEEQHFRLKNTTTYEKLQQKLCQGRSSNVLNDKRCKCILICSGIKNIKDHMTWIANINWFLILDFSEEKHQIIELLRNNVVKTPKQVTANQLTEALEELSSEELLFSLEIGEKLVYIQCNEVNGNDKGAISDMATWSDRCHPGISVIVMESTKNTRNECKENFLIISILDGDKKISEMAEILKDFKKWIGLPQIICLFEEEKLLMKLNEDVCRQFGPKAWGEQTIQVQWSQLQNFMEEKTKNAIFTGLNIVGSGGIPVPLTDKFLKHYHSFGIDILASNQCETYLTMNKKEKEDFCIDANVKIKAFLTGQEPTWEVFYFANPASVPATKVDIIPGIVDRDITTKIIEDLENMKHSDTKCVARKRVAHQPGAGATTIGKSVLWQLRKSMRCIVANGSKYGNEDINLEKLEHLATCILEIRAWGEEDNIILGLTDGKNACATVLVLFDNCPDLMAKALTSKIEKLVEKKRITFKKTMVLLLYLCNDFDMESFEDDYDIGNKKNVQAECFIEQKLSMKEKTMFENRLENLVKKSEMHVEDMLTFVIMAEDFKEDSDYVKGVVNHALINMEKLYPSQKKVLVYLSILKYFGNACLPLKHCRNLAFPLVAGAKIKDLSGNDVEQNPNCQRWRSFCPQVSIFLREDSTQGTYDMAVSFNYLEVSHIPVAYQLYKHFLKDETALANVVADMMQENALLNDAFAKEFVHMTFRKILVKRAIKETEESNRDKQRTIRDKFSKLIQTIMSNSNRENAKKLLEVGYKSLQEDNHPYIAQTLARFHYEHFEFQEAKEWAQKACDSAPENFTVRDTLGQVYKRELRHFIEQQKKSDKTSQDGYSLSNSEQILKDGKIAASHFRKAQKLYQKSKLTNEHKSYLGEKDIDGGDSSANNPGLFGEIEINLEILKHILNSKDIKESKRASELFLKVLRKEESTFEISSVFQNVEWSWKDYHDFISELYTRTSDSLQFVTRKLTYFNIFRTDEDQKIRLRILESYVKDFQDCFGDEESHKWRKFIDSYKKSPKQKMEYLRRLLCLGITNSFAWLLRRNQGNMLRNYRDYLKKMEEISKENPTNLSMIVEDKISYMNVAFAFKFLGMDNCNLKDNTIAKFSRELVEDDVDFPEPYFFFTMIYWPKAVEQYKAKKDKNDGPSDKDIELLSKCINKLGQFEDRYTDTSIKAGLYIGNKAKPIFFLKSNDGGRDKVISVSTQRKCHSKSGNLRIPGTLNSDKNVNVHFGNDKSLTIRAASLHNRGKNWVHSVTFSLGFTFAGPVAYHIESDERSSEQEKLKQDLGN